MGDREEERRGSLIVCPATGVPVPAADVGRTGFSQPEYRINVAVIPAKAGIPVVVPVGIEPTYCHPRESRGSLHGVRIEFLQFPFGLTPRDLFPLSYVLFSLPPPATPAKKIPAASECKIRKARFKTGRKLRNCRSAERRIYNGPALSSPQFFPSFFLLSPSLLPRLTCLPAQEAPAPASCRAIFPAGTESR